MASRLIRNQLPSNGLRVRPPCPPPDDATLCKYLPVLHFFLHWDLVKMGLVFGKRSRIGREVEAPAETTAETTATTQRVAVAKYCLGGSLDLATKFADFVRRKQLVNGYVFRQEQQNPATGLISEPHRSIHATPERDRKVGQGFATAANPPNQKSC